ncbi:hypothetical protein DY000_02041230 [Brassica cretica]|uniref:CASP-like protein n=1 Tax=Brassica cretica TaxID=69181 RepID=A0ABQ7BLB0_BRACR|nr:hypothetical protein DY000_02041230 [Brassica cretica]
MPAVRQVSNSCFRTVEAGSPEFPAKGAKMAAMAVSCSFVAFWTASFCAILSSMVSAKAAAVGAPPVLVDSLSDGESGRAMIFADATLSAPRWAPTV